jgi:peptidyl-prolyl cis-trans isomerase C
MRFLYLLLLLTIVVACSEQNIDSTPVVASVGKNTLTIQDVENIFFNETGLEISDTQIHRYVQRWIETELIYQEAVEQGLKEHPEIQKHLKDLEREFLVTKFVENYNNSEITITEQDIQKYYERYSDEFIRNEALYNLRIILAENYRTANTHRKEINAGNEFNAIARNHSLDGSKDKGGELGWTSMSELNSDLAKRVITQSPNRISTPIKTTGGYYLVEVLGVRKKGEIKTLEEVETIIVSRLKAEKGKDNFRQLITNLNEKYEIESNLEILKRFKNNSN